jgi:hypothetical protein
MIISMVDSFISGRNTARSYWFLAISRGCPHMGYFVWHDEGPGGSFEAGAKPVMNSFTYTRSEDDCVW